MLFRIAALLAVLILAAPAALPPRPTDYAGTVVAVNEQAITVQGKIGTRVFQIYPGTIFGKGNKQKLSDFKPGTPVIVVFSEITAIVKAENIRTNTPPKPKPPQKKPAGTGKKKLRGCCGRVLASQRWRIAPQLWQATPRSLALRAMFAAGAPSGGPRAFARSPVRNAQ